MVSAKSELRVGIEEFNSGTLGHRDNYSIVGNTCEAGLVNQGLAKHKQWLQLWAKEIKLISASPEKHGDSGSGQI